MYKYIHSGEIEELADVIPYEDFTDYTAEDFIQDHAIVTVGDEEDMAFDLNQIEMDEDDNEPSTKRFRNDFDSFDNEGSNDYDMRYGNNAPEIPSLLNLNLEPPQRGQEDKNVSENRSPTLVSPWETLNYNGSNQNANNNLAPAKKDRREGRRQGSRWSSSRR